MVTFRKIDIKLQGHILTDPMSNVFIKIVTSGIQESLEKCLNDILSQIFDYMIKKPEAVITTSTSVAETTNFDPEYYSWENSSEEVGLNDQKDRGSFEENTPIKVGLTTVESQTKYRGPFEENTPIRIPTTKPHVKMGRTTLDPEYYSGEESSEEVKRDRKYRGPYEENTPIKLDVTTVKDETKYREEFEESMFNFNFK